MVQKLDDRLRKSMESDENVIYMLSEMFNLPEGKKMVR